VPRVTDDGKRANVVALVGIDGSGKTSQARLLADWLTGLGEQASYVKTESGRSGLDRASRRAGAGSLADLVGADEAGLMFAALGWRSIRSATALREPGYVVMDRYVHCHYAMTRIVCPDREPAVRQLFAKFPDAKLTVYVQIEPQLALSRLAERGSTVHTAASLTAFDRAYRDLPEAADYVVVDGGRDLDTVQADLRRALRDRFELPAPRRPTS
jgi:dTMP kinase